ncbi:hypothetical protein GAO09_16515 [Rhizobiales bacterium RZME27]|jgi:hypothetical protein|uniref:Uncharacterized protein n=1 Tax=Endobacterium cereale TaxID=2663029 RepID=A0A6A8AD44_9HYPH|nr:hypothetical protein [Endobacterium cereale]MEB2846942.1 hypothetical protein [Endobacterium cereale]MQY47640.1 hypothetical protein [Endobacterium cereale]
MEKNAAASLTVELTPTQVRGLKLAKDGDLFPQEGKKWTHLDAQVTYAPSDRFKERPRAVKTATTVTVNQLREHGLLRELNPDVDASESAHGITMAGKIWLLKHK